jgi:hypothetical protein
VVSAALGAVEDEAPLALVPDAVPDVAPPVPVVVLAELPVPVDGAVEGDELVAGGGVVVVDEDDDAGGVGGGASCCWQAPSASRTLAASAVVIRRVIVDCSLANRGRGMLPRYFLAGLVPCDGALRGCRRVHRAAPVAYGALRHARGTRTRPTAQREECSASK